MSKIIIRTTDLTKSYESGAVTTHALRGVTLEIEKGSFTAIVGPSGHGKSTLMHLLGGLDRPSSGKVFVEETDLGGLDNSELARLRGEKVGFVFQFFNLLQGLTAKENIEVAAMLAGVPEKEQGSRAMALLEQVGLTEKAQSKPSQLSGGQQQRVAIARALVNDPALLLMDEPTGNLDSASEAEVLQILRKLHLAGKTVVVVTHNNDIAQKAEQIICVRDGLIAA